MAIAVVSTNRGTTTTTSGGTNPLIDLPAGASIAVGNLLILTAAYDNSGTGGVDPSMSIVSSTAVASQIYGQDLRGNLWWRIAKQVRNTAGSANDGSVVDIWISYVTTAYVNGDDLTLQFAFPVAGLAVRVAEFSGVNPLTYSVVTATTGVGNGTSITAPAITPTVSGQLVVAVGAIETNTAITGDADVTNGSWVALSNDVANTGVDATSQTLFAQYKLVSASGAQNWTSTKTGAADWAALAVVFGAFTSVANGFVPGNPNYPCIAGFEGLPLQDSYLPIDTGTEYFQTHQIFPNSYGTQQYNAGSTVRFNPMGSGASMAHHTIIHEVFASGSETVSDEVFSQYLDINNAAVGAGATVSSGTAQAALAQVGGPYITLPNNGYVDLFFSSTNLTAFFNTGYRVVRWGIRYLAWKDDSSDPSLGEGLIAEWRDSGANNGAGSAAIVSAWLVPNYKRDAQFEMRWCGEVNPIIRGKGEILIQNSPYNAAFTVNDLVHMGGGDETTRLRLYGAQGLDVSQATVYLDFIQAFVEVVPERRLAHGTRMVSNAPTFATSTYFNAPYGSTPMWSALNTNNRWQVPATASTYVLGTREAVPASPGDYYANQYYVAAGAVGRSVGWNEAIGPSWLLESVEQPRATQENSTGTGQPVLARGIINDGVLASPPEELDNFILPVAGLDLTRWVIDGAFWVALDRGTPTTLSEIYTANSQTARVVVDGATSFDRVKILIYPDELTTDSLIVTVEQPASTVLATTVITVAQALASLDVGEGWREVSLALDVPVTPSAGVTFVKGASTTPATAPWRWAVGFSMDTRAQFAYNYPNGAGTTRNRAVVLQCTLADPTYILDVGTYDLYRPLDRCLVASVSRPEITLTNGALYDWVSIERLVDNGGPTIWVPVTLIEDPSNGTEYIDTGAPWDMPSGTIHYRIRGWRNADHRMVESITTAWLSSITAPGAAFGLAGEDGELFVYVPTDESSLKVIWNPLNPTTIVPLLGVDYQIPLRAPEERGVETSFLVLVDYLLSCATTTDNFDNEVLSAGQASMSPTPYDQLRGVALQDRFQLLLPGGYNQFVTVTLGSLTITTSEGLYLAEVTLTPTTTPIIEPFEPNIVV